MGGNISVSPDVSLELEIKEPNAPESQVQLHFTVPARPGALAGCYHFSLWVPPRTLTGLGSRGWRSEFPLTARKASRKK